MSRCSIKRLLFGQASKDLDVTGKSLRRNVHICGFDQNVSKLILSYCSHLKPNAIWSFSLFTICKIR